MNESDKEMCKQAWVENDWDGHVNLKKFADLIRADEREACAKVCDAFQARDVGMQPAECAGAIRARGNT
jgi:hypothetical protein